MEHRIGAPAALLALITLIVTSFVAAPSQGNPGPELLWLNHFDLLPGGPEVTTTFQSTSSGVGGGLTGLVIESTTTGDVLGDGGNKVVHMAVDVPPDFEVTGVRLCYELTSSSSFITQIRLAQVQDPPSTALVLLDDGTDETAVGPVCVDSEATSIDPSTGALLLDLRVDFGDTADKIVVRGLALHLDAQPSAEDTMWLNHFDLLPGGPEVTTSFRSTSSGVGGGLTGLVIESTTTGDVFADGGNKVVHMALDVPLDFEVTGVRLCYELTSSSSFITQIRLAQVQDPPSSALVLLDDGTDQTAVGPVCVDSEATSSDPSTGALLLDLRVDFGDTADTIVVRGLALHLDAQPSAEDTMWLNHFDLLPGAAELTTSFRSTSSGVGGGLTGLVIESTTTGDVFADGGNKVVHMAVDVPPGFEVTGARLCYELTSSSSFITQIRLAQVQDPPSTALVMLDDGTDQTAVGPVCVDSEATSIDPSIGALLLSLRVDFGDIEDKIVVRGLALNLAPAAVLVDIDIKPGGIPNPIKLGSNGVTPVAILTTPSFDATTVDALSVCFGDAEAPAERDCTEAHSMGHIEDVDGDGDLDLVLHFETAETGIDAGDTEACLSGETFGGTPVEGCDTIKTL